MIGNFRVLIADTSPDSQSRFRNMTIWEDNGFEIASCVSNAAETVKMCKTGNIDLVLCCNKPPVLTAPEVMMQVRRGAGDIPFIIISPSDDSEYMRECFLMGAVDYLVEPVSELRLASAVARAKDSMKVSLTDYEYKRAADEFFSSLDYPEENEKFIAELKKFILASANVTATTEYAADFFGFNKDYFGRLFHAKLGMTFVEFYKRFRVCYAERLLRSGKYKVRDVSEMLGFASVDYFTTVFKKITGRKPSDLKKI